MEMRRKQYDELVENIRMNVTVSGNLLNNYPTSSPPAAAYWDAIGGGIGYVPLILKGREVWNQ